MYSRIGVSQQGGEHMSGSNTVSDHRAAAPRAIGTRQRYPLVVFVILSYAITWPGWWLEVQTGSPIAALLGYFGPAIAALLIAAVVTGAAGVEDLLARLLRWRVGLGWYGVAVLLPVLTVIAAVALQGLFSPAVDMRALAESGWRLAILAGFGTIYGVLIAAGEELGWRGFMLPRLLTRYNGLVASLIVGIVWGLWHLPLRWWMGGSGDALDVLLYGLGIDCAAVIYTWLYRRTRGSVLIASLFHAAYDVAVITAGQVCGPESSFFRVHMLVLGLTAAILVLTHRAEFLGTPMPPDDAPHRKTHVA